MRRWTLITIVVLFLGLAVAAVIQATTGSRGVRCPGPTAPGLRPTPTPVHCR